MKREVELIDLVAFKRNVYQINSFLFDTLVLKNIEEISTLWIT